MGRWLAKLAIALTLLGVLAWFAGRLPGDDSLFPPATGQPATQIVVLDHGYHAGVLLRRVDVARGVAALQLPRLASVLRDFSGTSFVEFGWGDEGFYRHVPTPSALTVNLALRAALGLNEQSVMHVVGYPDDVLHGLPEYRSVTISVSERGFFRLLQQLEESFSADAYGDAHLLPDKPDYGVFYAAKGRYHLFNVCNHWVARLLNAAGVPANLALATHSSLLMRQLRSLPDF